MIKTSKIHELITCSANVLLSTLSPVNMRANPVSLYAATKKSNELMAHAYSKLYNIPSTGLRFFTVYIMDVFQLVITLALMLTLGIYIIHFPLRFIVARIMKVNSLTEAVCFWLIVLIISAGITWIIGRIKIGRYLTKI